MALTVRVAELADDHALLDVDHATWGPHSSPVAPPERSARPSFFSPERPATDFLVGVLDGAVVGFVAIRAAGPSPSGDHVQRVAGFGVLPSAQRRGVGRALMARALEVARERGARKVTLAVLGHNAPARSLYEACGFEIEGVLRAQYRLEGVDVDDVLMARWIGPGPGQG